MVRPRWRSSTFFEPRGRMPRSSCSFTVAPGWVEKQRDYAFPADMFVNAGAHYVALDFTNVREAGGDLRPMAEQVRRGIAWVYRNAGSFGGDTRPVSISAATPRVAISAVSRW